MAQLRRFQSAFSLAKESVWGTGVDPDVMVPVNEVSSSPQYDILVDQGLRGIGSRDFDSIQGSGHGEVTHEGLVYNDEIGWLLAGMMGANAVAGTTVYTHTFNRGDSPPSFTLEEDISDAAASMALRFTGAMIGQLAFSFDAAAGALQYNATWMTQIPTKVTGISPVVSTTLPEPPAGWRGAVTSTNLAGIVVSGEFTLSRELQVVYTDGADQDPYAINAGPLAVEGRLVIAAEDLADFDAWKAHTEQSFVIVFTYGTGDTENSIKITMTQMNMANGPFEIDRSGVGVVFGVPFLGLHNSTDAGPCEIELINSQAAVY